MALVKNDLKGSLKGRVLNEFTFRVAQDGFKMSFESFNEELLLMGVYKTLFSAYVVKTGQ